MMNSVDKRSTLIPKFKQQLIFLEEREKLFKTNDYSSNQLISSSSSSSASSNASPISTTNSNVSLSSSVSLNNPSSEESVNNLPIDQARNIRDANIFFSRRIHNSTTTKFFT